MMKPMDPEAERWAEALAIHRRYGVGAPEHVAERLGALGDAGDGDGVERWMQIAARLDHLRRGETH
jgi:hypothetical protein